MNYDAKNIINGEDFFLMINHIFNIVFLLKYLNAMNSIFKIFLFTSILILGCEKPRKKHT